MHAAFLLSWSNQMPDINEYNTQEEWMKVCVPKMMDEGKDNEQAVGACMGMWNNKTDAMKYQGLSLAVKAVGDWELDVLANPFNKPDSDKQTFDDGTDFMLDTFNNPAILYHHGVMPGKQSLQDKPIIIGKSMGVTKQADGIHVRVLLDKSIEWAKRVWDAAKKGLAVASSDSISHLARLDVAGKRIMYEKGRTGRIAVWPLAGLSLWDKVDGNFLPASNYAIALPAMKAIYKDAGLQFPEIVVNTDGDLPEAENAAKRARIVQLQTRAYLQTIK
jgi:hypothetical protein